MTEIDLEKLTAETQTLCDDASHDYLYFTPDHQPLYGPAGAIGMQLGGNLEVDQRRAEALKFSIVQIACSNRANGRGQIFIRFVASPDGLEVRWRTVRTAADAFAAIKELAA